MSLDLSDLNVNQKSAVLWKDGPLLVLAGPGSGKTRVLTYHIARLLQESPDEYFRILGLTFTTKAAAEIRERVNDLIPGAGDRALLSTFHSFAGNILRQHGFLIGLRPDFTILPQDTEREAVLEEVIAKANLDDDLNFTAKKLLPIINRLLDRAVDMDGAISLLTNMIVQNPKIIANLYIAYRREMIERNNMDFGCLIVEAIRLLKEKPFVKRQVQLVYKYICVDEFQDTNHSQYELLSLLVNPETRNVFVVADDDQIIYQWNGASPERLRSLQTDYGMTVMQLPQNYRCPPEVIDLANKLISHNPSRSTDKQELTAFKEAKVGEKVRLLAYSKFEDEAAGIAQDIKSRPSNEYGRCVVLARARKLLEQIVTELKDRDVPAHLAIRKDDWSSAPLRLVHSLLRLANNRQDDYQLARVCKSFYLIEGINLAPEDIVSTASTYNGDFLRTFSIAALARKKLSPLTKAFLQDYLPWLMERLNYNSFTSNFFVWVDALIDNPSTTDEQLAEYQEERDTWKELVREIEAQYGDENVTLHLLLQELDLRSKAPKPPKGAVLCYTIHAAKGLEFDHVYLVGMVEDQLPSWAAVKKGDDSEEMQEERRNCFVAITRTQETLTLSYSQTIQGRSKRPSRFLFEMGVL